MATKTAMAALPALGSVWTYGQLDRACQAYADAQVCPFRFALVDIDFSDEDAPPPETLTLRCSEPARPNCSFKVVVDRMPAEKANLWCATADPCALQRSRKCRRVSTVVESHTHWQSVFADPKVRQEAIELSEKRAAEAAATTPVVARKPKAKSPTSPRFDLPHLPAGPHKPLLWTPSKNATVEPEGELVERRPVKPYTLVDRVLPHAPTLEEWQTRFVPLGAPHRWCLTSSQYRLVAYVTTGDAVAERVWDADAGQLARSRVEAGRHLPHQWQIPAGAPPTRAHLP
jgi:hypothetical protein